MRCERVREDLTVRLLSQGRSGPLDAASAAHLDGCAACAAEHRRLRHTRALLSRVPLEAFDALGGPAAVPKPATARGTRESTGSTVRRADRPGGGVGPQQVSRT
jgi:anti-sigma factor RsiW